MERGSRKELFISWDKISKAHGEQGDANPLRRRTVALRGVVERPRNNLGVVTAEELLQRMPRKQKPNENTDKDLPHHRSK